MLDQVGLCDEADLKHASKECHRIWRECVADVKNLTGSSSVLGYQRRRLLEEQEVRQCGTQKVTELEALWSRPTSTENSPSVPSESGAMDSVDSSQGRPLKRRRVEADSEEGRGS